MCLAPRRPLAQRVPAELRKHFGDLAEQVVAVAAGERSQVLAVPPAGAVAGGGSAVGQRRHLGCEPRIEEERERQPPMAAVLRTRCGVDLYHPPVSRSSMSPILQTSVPGIGGASIQPSGAATCNPPLSSCASSVSSP